MKKRILSVCMILSLFLGGVPMSISRASAATAEQPALKLQYDAPATDWETEGLPLGNGFLGATVYGGVEQDDFLNGAIELETLLSPIELLHFLQKTELEAGRERKIHWGPRTLDLDILFYEDVISQTKELMIPHPDMQNREFVLKPLTELCPYYMHPLFHKSVKQMLEELSR